jgi:hypothetical protein
MEFALFTMSVKAFLTTDFTDGTDTIHLICDIRAIRG